MKEAIKTKDWVDSPYYLRDLTDLYKVGSRVDAWRDFLLSEKIDVLRKLGMLVMSFNQHDLFNRLIIRLDCSEDEAIAGIRSVMRPGHERDVSFFRRSIHDKTAWAYLPLSCFADAQGFNEWDRDKEIWQSDILKFNQMPQLMVGVEKEWNVDPSCFTFSHKIRRKTYSARERYAQVSFNHPHLDQRFKDNQHVVSGTFPVDEEIKTIKNNLMELAMDVCAKQAVFVQERRK